MAATPVTAPEDHPTGAAFWLGAVVGGAIVAFGVHGLWVSERAGATSAAQWFVGGALALDLLIVPAAAIVGALASRVVPAWAWPIVRAALFTSAILIALAAPLVLHQGGIPGNPTVRPRDYRTGLTAALAVTWATAVVGVALARARRRRRRRA